MLRILYLSLALVGFCSPLSAAPFSEFFPEIYDRMPEELRAEVDVLDLEQGDVTLFGRMATLNVSDDYYFIGPEGARFVVETVWGNPQTDGLLGMVFPRDFTPFDEQSWGLTVQFEDIGYVSDEDAEKYDYATLLKTMQSDMREENKWRAENGYEKIDLVGWAAEPFYDPNQRKLHWAKHLRFGSDEVFDTLNYNIRALGRHGVLVMNFIAGMDQLPEVEAAVPEVLSMVSFTEGNRYADFLPGVDTVAAVGIGGLIAGKVVAKSGFLIAGLLFLKKFGLLLLLPLFALKNRIFGGRRNS